MYDVTRILSQIESGDQHASEELLPLVYNELRYLATSHMVNERADHTLQATALVHEAYVRLVDAKTVQKWDSRGHFFAAAAEAMRRILVERARAKCTQKRGRDWNRVDLDDRHLDGGSSAELVMAISESLEEIAREDSKLAELVKLRYFGGFSLQEAAQVLGTDATRAQQDWRYVKARLRTLLKQEE